MKTIYPGQFDQDYRSYEPHPRNSKIIDNNKGKVLKFKDLPKPAQCALAYYMAIDGEAWELEPNIEDFLDDFWATHNNQNTQHYNECCAKLKTLIEKNIQFYIDEYGNEKFGYVEVPTNELVESVNFDKNIAVDWNTLIGYRRNPSHNLTDWPSILSGFHDETFEDGWNRFFNAIDANKQIHPCVWFPHV